MRQRELHQANERFTDLVRELGGAPGAAPVSEEIEEVLRVVDWDAIPDRTRVSAIRFVLPGAKPVHGVVVLLQEMDDDGSVGVSAKVTPPSAPNKVKQLAAELPDLG